MQSDNFNIYNLKLSPTYSVLYKKRFKKNNEFLKTTDYVVIDKTSKQLENEKNLKDNSTSGYLSDKAVKAIKLSVNWLIASASWKKIHVKKGNFSVDFKLNFITLTLPTNQGKATDQQLKKELLNPFLMILKSKFDFNSYIWKAEAQQNKNLHFHIISDCYLPYEEIRFLWNRLLIKKGFMEEYTNKFSKMSLNDYYHYCKTQSKTSFQLAKKRFLYGLKTAWSDPNSTDIHKVQNVKDVAAYIAGYMGKKDCKKRPVNGRIWSCSYNLSAKNKCIVEFEQHELDHVVDEIESFCEKSFEIYSDENSTFPGMIIATIFFHHPQDLRRIRIDKIKQKYTSHLSDIQNYERTTIFNTNLNFTR